MYLGLFLILAGAVVLVFVAWRYNKRPITLKEVKPATVAKKAPVKKEPVKKAPVKKLATKKRKVKRTRKPRKSTSKK